MKSHAFLVLSLSTFLYSCWRNNKVIGGQKYVINVCYHANTLFFLFLYVVGRNRSSNNPSDSQKPPRQKCWWRHGSDLRTLRHCWDVGLISFIVKNRDSTPGKIGITEWGYIVIYIYNMCIWFPDPGVKTHSWYF